MVRVFICPVHSCMHAPSFRLPAVDTDLTAGLALKSLVTHLAGRSGLPAQLQTTVCLLGHVFNYEAFRRAIAESGRAGIRLQFAALLPTVDAGALRTHASSFELHATGCTIRQTSVHL